MASWSQRIRAGVHIWRKILQNHRQNWLLETLYIMQKTSMYSFVYSTVVKSHPCRSIAASRTCRPHNRSGALCGCNGIEMDKSSNTCIWTYWYHDYAVSISQWKMLGQHTADSGSTNVWMGSEILGPNSMEKEWTGRSYARGLQTH